MVAQFGPPPYSASRRLGPRKTRKARKTHRKRKKSQRVTRTPLVRLEKARVPWTLAVEGGDEGGDALRRDFFGRLSGVDADQVGHGEGEKNSADFAQRFFALEGVGHIATAADPA